MCTMDLQSSHIKFIWLYLLVLLKEKRNNSLFIYAELFISGLSGDQTSDNCVT